jgi:hypothetical protein
MTTRTGTICLLLLFAVAPAAAQDTPLVSRSGVRPLVQPDGTYIFQHLPHSDIIFEGQIAPRIIIVDSIGRATRRVLLDGKPASWGYQVSATPMVRLRMFDETSSPVRTPSYMPKGTIQLVRFRNVSASDDTESDEFNRGPIEMWLVDAIPFGHHSNGQDGCLFTSETRDADGECVEIEPAAAGTVNKKDGSFSTNYIEASIHYGRMHLDSAGAAAGDFATRWEWRAGVGVQLNPEGYVGGSIKPALADLYGPTRVLFSAMTARRDAWRCGRASAEGRFQYLTDPPPGVPSVITNLEGACFPRGWGGAGLFVRFYHGQDYYNLGFAESITRVQFGVALQKDQFLSFRIKPI